MKATNLLRLIPLASLAMGFSLAIMPPIFAQADDVQQNLSDLRPLSGGDSVLSMSGGQKLMDEALEAISAQDYDVAVEKLQDARQVYNQLSNFHLDIARSFEIIDTQVYDSARRSAIAAGDMRDTATYRLALVHRAQGKTELSVPLLIQVIRSQSPVSDLGEDSTQQLYELGFTALPGEGESAAPVDENSLLSMDVGQGFMDEAIKAISAKDYDLAVEKFQDARQIFNQLSNFHLNLSTSFQGIDIDVYNASREAAITAGDLRDTATYRLALVHRVQGKSELSVPLLIQVIRSQSPDSDLGDKSYAQLLELGFVEREFDRPNS